VPHQLELTAPNRPSTPTLRRDGTAERSDARVLEGICRAGWEVKITHFPSETPRPLWQVSGWDGEATIWAEAESLGRALKALARKARVQRG
jgi:hypothetical protein